MHIANVVIQQRVVFCDFEITPERTERRVVLSKRELATLEKASGLLSRIRGAVDPHNWSDYDHAQDRNEFITDVALACHCLDEIVEGGGWVVDDAPRYRLAGARVVECKTPREVPMK